MAETNVIHFPAIGVTLNRSDEPGADIAPCLIHNKSDGRVYAGLVPLFMVATRKYPIFGIVDLAKFLDVAETRIPDILDKGSHKGQKVRHARWSDVANNPRFEHWEKMETSDDGKIAQVQSEEKGGRREARPVYVEHNNWYNGRLEGKIFPSMSSAARQFGVSWTDIETICCKRGDWKDFVPLDAHVIRWPTEEELADPGRIKDIGVASSENPCMTMKKTKDGFVVSGKFTKLSEIPYDIRKYLSNPEMLNPKNP